MKHFNLNHHNSASTEKNIIAKRFGLPNSKAFFGAGILLVAQLVSIGLIAQPTITSLSSNQGAPGSTINISGSNFNATAANNVVYFGATQATVNSASATALNVTVPFGATYAPVTVDNTATNLMGYSDQPFLPDYNNSAYIPHTINFDAQVNFADAGNPNFLQTVIMDVNGDGKPDMIVAGTVISIYINTSASGSITSGSFAAPIDIAVPGTGLAAVAAGDIDGDGRPDLAFCTGGNDSIYILRNSTTGGSVSFAAPVAFQDSSTFYSNLYPVAIAIMDIDGDGKADIVTCTYGNGNIAVLRNTATAGTINTGSLAAPTEFFSGGGGGPVGMAIDDLDGDGKPEIVIADADYYVWVFQNTSVPGALNFGSPVSFGVGNFPMSVVISDIDGDGKPDLAVVNQSDNTMAILQNTSTPGTINNSSFAAPVTFAAGDWPLSIVAGDFDGDGKPDLAVATNVDAMGLWSEAIMIFRNTAVPGTIDNTSMIPETSPTSNLYTGSIISGDIDGDGKADLITTNLGVASISVFRNDPLYIPPTITAVSPYVDSDGTSVTITGTGFNTNAANDIVYFGATQATVNAASATSLQVIVPVGATYGPVTVNNTVKGLTAYSPYYFLPDYNNSAYVPGTVNFDPQVNYGLNGYQVIMADVDGDGKADMVVAGYQTAVYLNNSTSGSITSSSFAAPVFLPISSAEVAVGDIDGDGKPDLVFINGFDSVRILRNTSTTGSVSFGSPVAFIINNWETPQAIAIADIDGDGKPDVVIGNNSSGNISIYHNEASAGTINTGSLSLPLDFYGGGEYSSIAVEDIDGDGKPDIVAVGNGDSVQVFRNTCTPGNINGIAAPVSFAVGNGSFAVLTADIDGDGKADIVVTNTTDSTLSVLRNTSSAGNISFTNQVVFATGGLINQGASNIAAGDFDGDGKPDIAVANITDNSVSVFRNTAIPGIINTSSFMARVNFASGNGPASIAVGDMDGDGKADIANLNFNDNSISLLRNDPLIFSTITGNANVCMGSTTTLTDAQTGGAWSSGNSAVATVGPTGIVTGVTAGTATISYVTGISNTTIVVTVNTLLSAGSITGPNSVYTGYFVTLNDSTTGGIWSSSNTVVAVVNGSGVVTGVATGTAAITYTMTNSCGSAYAYTNMTVIAGGPSCVTASNIATFAGDHVDGDNGDGGHATAAEIGSSFGVVADASGNVYITDYFNNVVRKVSSSGIITTVAGNGAAGYNGDNISATSAELNGPMGVALDGAGNLYIADKYNDRIRMVNSAGVITTFAGTGHHGDYAGYGYGNGGQADSANLDYPVAIAIDCSGNMYIADQGSETVRKINTTGIINFFAGTGGGGYNGDGIPALTAQLNYPSGVAADCYGNVYIADAWNNRVRKVDATGVITTVAGNGSAGYGGDGHPGGSAELWIPTGVTLDACGDLYICDWQNNVVRFLNTDGYISTFAGNNVRGYDGDGGPADSAELYLPSSLTIDGHGNVYIADYGNYVVRGIGNSLPPERRFENGTTQNLAACENATAISINNLMGIPDVTSGITETWVVTGSPVHGTLSGFTATATSRVGVTTPTELTYTPDAGYTGTDEFTVKMSDGTTSASTTVNVKVDALPSAGEITGVTNIASGSSITLADATGNASGVWSSSNNLVATVSAAGVVTGVSNGSATIYYTVSNSCGSNSATGIVTVDNEAALSSNVLLVPNPNRGTFTIKGQLATSNDEEVTLEVRDMLGQLVYGETVTAKSGQLNETITLNSGLANGMYMLNMLSGTNKKVFHFVIEQ